MFRRCTLCSFYYVRDPTLRDEHESSANIWSCITKLVLARTLGLFLGASSGYVGRFRGFSVGAGRFRPVLRKASSLQYQALHFSSRPPSWVIANCLRRDREEE